MSKFLILLGTFLFSFNLWAADCGRFSVVKGDVTYKEKDKADYTKARINKKICQGDSVKTGSDSRAKIVMADKNEINLSPETEMKLEVYANNPEKGEKKVLLNVLYGKMRSNVKEKYKDNEENHYRVKTKSAVAGVRGTDFLTSFDRASGKSQVVTFTGEVAVGEMKGGQLVVQVLVRPGHATSNRIGQRASRPRPVAQSEMARMNRETNVSEPSVRDVSTDAPDSMGGDDGAEPDDSKEVEPTSPNEPVSDDGGGDMSSNDGPSGPVAGETREPASIEGDSMGLPPPTIEDMPSGGDLGFTEPPKIPNLNPVVVPLPECLTCNDAILNKNVRVQIVPRLPNQ